MSNNQEVKKEIKFVVPDVDDREFDMEIFLEKLGKFLCKTWGGYTVFITGGAWVSPDGELVEELSRTFFVAVPEKTFKDELWIFRKEVILKILKELNQDAVYWVDTDGVAHIETTDDFDPRYL